MLLVENMLGGGKNSLFYKELVERRKLASNVQVEFDQMELMSLFVVRATAAAGVDSRQLSAAIDEVVDTFLQHKADKKRLKRARIAIKLEKTTKSEKSLRPGL